MRLYEDAITKELVVGSGNNEARYPVFSELSRIAINTDSIRIESISTGKVLVDTTIFSDLQDSGGTPYASFVALQTELDKYFDSTV